MRNHTLTKILKKIKEQGSGSSPSSRTNKFKAEWTGKCPCKYLGEWKLTKNGEDVTYLFPTNLRYCPAYTFGEYPVWEECPYTYVEQYVEDGLNTPEWIQANLYWLTLVGDNAQDFKSIYDTFHESDFRTSKFM